MEAVTRIGDWARARAHFLKLVTCDLTPVLKDIGEHMLLRVSDAFRAETSPAGEKWKKSKKREGKTLTGPSALLRKSMTYAVRGDVLHVGSNKLYARIHNYGGETGHPLGRFQMPKRTYLEITEEDQKYLDESLLELVKE